MNLSVKSLFRTALLMLTLLCILCTVSCFNKKTPERSYFSIDYALSTQPRYTTPKYNADIIVQNITSALAYDRQEIVYRSNPYEFQYYWYRLWASKPRKMLRELITGHLRYTQLFSHVSQTIEDRMPDYMLDVEILSIEEMDVSDSEWYAHMALQFTLQRVSDNTNVWTYSFDARRAVADNQPVYVVKAMSELLDAELVKAFQDMDEKLSTQSVASNRHAHLAEDTSSTDAEPSNSSETPSTDKSNMPSATLKNKKQ